MVYSKKKYDLHGRTAGETVNTGNFHNSTQVLFAQFNLHGPDNETYM